MKNFATLTRLRIQLTLRNKMFLFFTVIMPFGFFFLYAGIFARGIPRAVRFFIGPVVALTVMGSFWGLSAALVMFREQGILRRFRLAPVGPAAMLSSSIISNYFLTWPTVIIEFLICLWVFRMGSWGNLWGIFFLVSIGAATFSAFGLIVASVTNNMQETQVINNIIWFAFLFLSGATFPLMILPGWLQHAALFLPATYLVAGLQGAMLKTASFAELAGDVVALAAGLALAFEISRQLFRWEPEAKVPGRAKAWVAAAMVPFLLLGVWENLYGSQLSHISKDFRVLEEQSMPGPSR